jgi:transcriptional regulator with XRE-family HTH domain
MREGVGLSRRALAEGADCSHQHLAYIETGQRPLTHHLAHRVAVAIVNHYNRPVAA